MHNNCNMWYCNKPSRNTSRTKTFINNYAQNSWIDRFIGLQMPMRQKVRWGGFYSVGLYLWKSRFIFFFLNLKWFWYTFRYEERILNRSQSLNTWISNEKGIQLGIYKNIYLQKLITVCNSQQQTVFTDHVNDKN